MASKRVRRAFIREPVFQAEFVVQKGGSLEGFMKWYAKKLKVNDSVLLQSNPYVKGKFFCHTGSGHAGAIWINDKAGLGIITHECFHAVFNLLKVRGLEVDYSSEEVFAYYQQFLVNEICKKLMGWK